MKKIGMIAAVLVLLVAGVSARDRVVSADALPKAAKDFIAANFAGKTATYVEQEFNKFEVHLNDGTEIDFTGNGDWLKVKSYTGFPTAILPAAVTSYVSSNFAGATIYEADKDWNSIELKLSNRMELFFDINGKFLGQKFDD